MLQMLQNEIKNTYSLDQIVGTTNACERLLNDIDQKDTPLNKEDYLVIENCREAFSMIVCGDLIGCEGVNVIETLGKAATVLMSQKVIMDCGNTSDKVKIAEALSFIRDFQEQIH